MKDILIEIVTLIFVLSGVGAGCLLALLVFWHYGKDDIKEYLNGKETK